MEEKKKKDKKEFLRAVKFTLFSISAGIIQIVSFIILEELIKMPKITLVDLGNSNLSLSYIISLVLSVIWNFTLNRKLTFKSANNVPIAMLKVFGYYVVFTPTSTWLQAFLVSVLKPMSESMQSFFGSVFGAGTGLATLEYNEYVALILCMLLNFVTEFLFQRWFVFKKTLDTNDIAQREREKEEAKLAKENDSNIEKQEENTTIKE